MEPHCSAAGAFAASLDLPDETLCASLLSSFSPPAAGEGKKWNRARPIPVVSDVLYLKGLQADQTKSDLR